MTKMFLLFSHTITNEQKDDAKKSFGVGEFVALSDNLQELWSNVPPNIEDINIYLEPIIDYLKTNFKNGDIALVQGDFGATCKIANIIKELGGVAVYSTTNREVKEEKIGDVIKKISHFKHIRFRKYE